MEGAILMSCEAQSFSYMKFAIFVFEGGSEFDYVILRINKLN